LAALLNRLRRIPKIRLAAVIRIPRYLFQRQQCARIGATQLYLTASSNPVP
jgi:hypothetical protein